MDQHGKLEEEEVLEGIFAVAKPAHVSSADVLQKLQITFASSNLFAPLLRSQPKRTSKGEDQVFKLGHGGTLDPLAAGVLIVGIGRGTKQLNKYLACTKTYDTVVLFGASTDSYDCTGAVTERADCKHVTRELVEAALGKFRGTIMQTPPIYSALKINGIKACEYVREGKELPRQLESREMHVDECTLLEWYEPGQHDIPYPNENIPASAPAVLSRLTVSSGFYVRSFAHDLGIACGSRSHMTSLRRTRQDIFTAVEKPLETTDLVSALTFADLDAGEQVWGAKLGPQLVSWVKANPLRTGHVDGRNRETKDSLETEKGSRPRQRFRGEWVAETKEERIKQQGGKYKGKWNRRKQEPNSMTTISSSSADVANLAPSTNP